MYLHRYTPACPYADVSIGTFVTIHNCYFYGLPRAIDGSVGEYGSRRLGTTLLTLLVCILPTFGYRIDIPCQKPVLILAPLGMVILRAISTYLRALLLRGTYSEEGFPAIDK